MSRYVFRINPEDSVRGPAKAKRHVVREEPSLIDGQWTVPDGMKHPSCPSCEHLFYELKPEVSVGNASVLGPTCRWCERELHHLGEL